MQLPSESLVRYRWRQTYGSNARAYTRITYSTTTTTGFALGTRYVCPVVVGTKRYADVAADDASGDGLVWPAMLHAVEYPLVAAHLERVPFRDRQVLLDEMASCHRHRPVQSPVAYIAGLVRRCLAGDFVPARAHLERAARERAHAVEGAVTASFDHDGSGSEPGRPHASTPETARLHLAAIRAGLKQARFTQAGAGHA